MHFPDLLATGGELGDEDTAFSGLSTDGAAAEEEEAVRTAPWPAGKGGGGGSSAETGNAIHDGAKGEISPMRLPFSLPKGWEMGKGIESRVGAAEPAPTEAMGHRVRAPGASLRSVSHGEGSALHTR